MDAAVDRHAISRPLELLGIGASEERAYRALLECHTATAAEIAGRLAVSLRVARKLLADLEVEGLATHTPKVPRVYVAAPPEFAVAALIKQRQAMLERVRVAIPGLEAQSARSQQSNGQVPVLETITSRAHLGVVLAQMYESFRNEAMCFQRAPTLMPEVSPPRMARAGAIVRTISDDSLLEAHGALERIREDAACGELARTIPVLPFKMMIFDRRAAVVSLGADQAGNPAAVLIHGSVLLQALCRLFDCVWERATPILFGHGEGLKHGEIDARTGEVADALIPLLAAGLNDKAIAAELGISSATLNRRMSELMRTTGTRSRFQLGWHAALQTASSRPLAKTVSV
jgi:sugar-specific transcriptional regulator TrmB